MSTRPAVRVIPTNRMYYYCKKAETAALTRGMLADE